MIELLEESAELAAQMLAKHDYVRVISHNDADGITSAGIICNALYRRNIKFHASIISHLDEEFVRKLENITTIFCDMGSGQPDLIPSDAIVLDHHMPTETDTEHLQVNPHLVGIDGSFELSASGVTYTVAKYLGNNTDLSGLAIVGALGDCQPMVGANKDILDEALQHNIITSEHSLKLGEGDVKELLIYSTDPYIDITGDADKIQKFLGDLGIDGKIEDLAPEDLQLLTSALMLKVMKKASLDATESLIGESYKLNYEVVSDAALLVKMTNSSGKLGETGLALALCLRDVGARDQAYQLCLEYQKRIISEMKKVEQDIKEGVGIRYVHSSDEKIIGALASTIIQYVASDKPILVMNDQKGKIKISARGTRKLLQKGLDLSVAMSEAAKNVGGVGGGHDIASGAAIPVETESKFLKNVDAIITEQLGFKGEC
ncbi:MAG: DHH family phosphoesterase [Methanocellales archaeon]|nr:DHH family phosphoesterase [Methanocellales archaeon]